MASEESGGSGGGGGDPYATPKANLRDTVKWLAGIFAALAAVVIAGTPISGLGSPSLSLGRTILGSLAILLSFGCICTALVMMLRLLRADLMYRSDLDPRISTVGHEDAGEIDAIRKEIAAHRRDLVPDYNSYQDFVQQHEEADAAAETNRQDWVNTMASANSTPEEIAAAKAQYDFQLEQIRAFESVEAGVLAYASYLRFYNRLRASTRWLITLGVLALFGLMGFSFAVQAPKDEKGPSVVVVPIVSPPPTPASAPPEPAKERALIGTVLFETGSATLSAQAREAVEHARDDLLAKPDTALLLIARTDTVGGSSVNHTLARDRAGSIRELLVGVGGVAAVRVFAAEVPKSDLPKLTEDHRENAENRSVSMYLIPFRR